MTLDRAHIAATLVDRHGLTGAAADRVHVLAATTLQTLWHECEHCGGTVRCITLGADAAATVPQTVPVYAICECEEAQRERQQRRARMEQRHGIGRTTDRRGYDVADGVHLRTSTLGTVESIVAGVVTHMQSREGTWSVCGTEDERIARVLPVSLRGCEWRMFPATGAKSEAARKCMEAARHVRDGGDRGLYLHGPVGAGKSSLLACVIKDVLRGGRAVVRWDWAPLCERVKSEFGGENRDATVRACVEADVLVLDDPGKSGNTDYDSRLLFAIADERLRAGRPTLVASNFAPDLLAALPGERWPAIASRLASGRVVLVQDRDWRRG